MCANTLSMAPSPHIFLHGKRGKLESKNYLTSWCMGCFSESTVMNYCSGVLKRTIQRKYCVTSTMDHSRDILQATKMHIKSCRLVSIGPHCSNMLMLMPANVWSDKGVPIETRIQLPHCILSQWKKLFNDGAWILSEKYLCIH